MATVLVTGAGGASGIGALRSLHEMTQHDTVGVDMDPTAAGIHLADTGTTVPPASDEEWIDAMAAVIERFNVDVVVPTVDEELSSLPALARELSEAVPIITPGQDVVDVALDKYETYNSLKAAGHAVPQTWLTTDAQSIPAASFPVVFKPRRGRGSRGVARFDTPDELTEHISKLDEPLKDFIVQEYISGTEYTTSVVGTSTGQLLAVVPKEAIAKEGSTVLGATRRAPAVTASCRRLFETLEPTGPMNVQQLVDEDGTPRTIEINPRFSSTSCLTVDAGINEFDLLIRDALGEPVDCTGDYESDRYIIRYDGHLFTDELARAN